VLGQEHVDNRKKCVQQLRGTRRVGAVFDYIFLCSDLCGGKDKGKEWSGYLLYCSFCLDAKRTKKSRLILISLNPIVLFTIASRPLRSLDA